MARRDKGYCRGKSCLELLGREHSESSVRKIYLEDLTLKQIHHFSLEKRRVARSTRLEQFHRTGRVIPFAGETNTIEDIKRWSHLEIKRTNTCRSYKHVARQNSAYDRVVGTRWAHFCRDQRLSTLGVLNRNVAAGFQQPMPGPTPILGNLSSEHTSHPTS
jgi:hypothetical protein